jgi:predicted porin
MKSQNLKLSILGVGLACIQLASDARADEASDAQIKALTKRIEELEKAQAANRAAAPTAPQSTTAPPPYSAKAPFIPSVDAPMTTGSSPFTYGSENISVTLYGLVSAGLVTVSNINGAHWSGFLSGPQQPPRFGAKTFWDLGNGNSAVLVLEGGYSLANGTLGQGGRIFGRQAYVGAQSTKWGALTVGRQYDEVASNTWWTESGNVFATFGDHVGDNDNIANTFRFNNSIRYQSPKLGRLTFAAQYALSNLVNSSTTSQVNNNSGWSAGGQYDGRDGSQNGLRLAAAITRLRNPNSSTNANGAVDSGYGFSSPFITSPTAAKAGVARHTMAVSGASYTVNPFTVTAGYSTVHFTYLDGSGLKLKNYEIFGTWYITPKLLAGLAFMYTSGRSTANTDPNYRQVNIGVDYFLNRYMDVFLVDNFQRAGGSATQAQIYTLAPSSGKTQNALTAGVRVKF